MSLRGAAGPPRVPSGSPREEGLAKVFWSSSRAKRHRQGEEWAPKHQNGRVSGSPALATKQSAPIPCDLGAAGAGSHPELGRVTGGTRGGTGPEALGFRRSFQFTRGWTMDSIKKMDTINVTALPMIAVDERMVISVNVRKALQSVLRKQLRDHPPTCIVGSLSEVNKKITEIDLGPSMLASTSKTAEKNLLAELYQHPEFDETKPTKLPNGVDFCDMVGNVIRSEKNPLSGKSYCSDRELEKFLSSPFFSAMWLDSFWWIFHERYQPKKEIQNKLFDRIALNYAFLLFKTVRSHYVEALIKSWFNTHEFKSAICDTMELWVSGTYPCPQSYDSWDYSELDPERFRREEMLQSSRLIRDQPSSTLSSRKASQQVKRISEARACMSFCLKKSHPACKIPKMTLNKFNIYGNSPLLVYFFLNYSRLRPHGQDVLMNRSEKTKLIPYPCHQTSATSLQKQGMRGSIQALASSLAHSGYLVGTTMVKKNMDTRRKKLRQLSQLHESEWTYFNSYLTELQENYMREVKIINKKVAEKRKANNVFLSPSILFDDLFDKKSRGNPHNEMAFLSRKKIKDVEERQKILSSSSSFQRPVDNYSLGLKSPYRIGSISSEAIASMTKVTQDMLFRLSPSIE
ncbi:family with sequence similarity 227 member A [Cricetulus griseus]